MRCCGCFGGLWARWKLRNVTDDSVPLFSWSGTRACAKVVKVYDGDTVRLAFLDRAEVVKVRARLLGFDAAELRPPKIMPDREREVELACKARSLLVELIGPSLFVTAHLGEFDKYGRVLATLYGTGGVCLNDEMLRSGYVRPYAGGARVRVS
jgi:endonuclease YncB( thermonuclease family)